MSSTPDQADPADVVTEADGESGALPEESPVTDAAAAVTDEAAVHEPEPEPEPPLEERAPEREPEPDPEPEPEPEPEPDPQLLAAHDLALAALREITPEATVGAPADYRVEAGGVVSLRFANRLAGYPGWFWTVSIARVEDAEPTVLEVELLPGDGALLAPDWVPWAVRLADYHAAQAALAEAAHDEDLDEDVDDDEDLDDVEDLDASDFDDDGSPILHAGDVDGVDIDELAEAGADDDEDFDDDDSEEDDNSDDEDDDSDDEDDDSDEDDDDSEYDEDSDDSDDEDDRD
jgi:hypothetical protein